VRTSTPSKTASQWQPGEIHLVRLPFGDVPGMKLRPVLVLTPTVGPVPEVLVASATDLILDPSQPAFRPTNVKVPSALRLHKLATIHSSSLARHRGVLEAAQRNAVSGKLRTLLGL
jgi:mRNA interferase MazF